MKRFSRKLRSNSKTHLVLMWIVLTGIIVFFPTKKTFSLASISTNDKYFKQFSIHSRRNIPSSSHYQDDALVQIEKINNSLESSFHRSFLPAVTRTKRVRKSKRSLPHSFERYIKWHGLMRACLQNDSCGHPRPRILLWRCRNGIGSLCWGIGDRMRGMISSMVLAMMTKRMFLIDWPNRPFPIEDAISNAVIDWTLPKSLNYSSWPTANDHSWPLLRWEKCHPVLTCIKDSSMEYSTDQRINGKPIIPKHLNFSESRTYIILDEVPHFVIHSRSLNSYRGRLLHRPEWALLFHDFKPGKYSPFQINRILMKSLFRPSKTVQDTIEKIIPVETRKRGYVSIHARTGHDVGERSIRRFTSLPSEPEILAQRILYCAEMNGIKKSEEIFFATDSSSLKTSFERIAKERNYNAYLTKYSAMHIALGVKNEGDTEVDLNEVNDSAWFSFLNIFVEFFGLAGGKYMISTHSEFSRLAFLIGDARRPIGFNMSCSDCTCKK